MLYPAAPLHAQNTVLVSNFGQSDATSVFGTVFQVNAQAFTTGGVSGGYTLSSIEVQASAALNASGRATVGAELWSSDDTRRPNSKLAELTVPATVSAGTVTFAAPPGTTLDANTTYNFVYYTTSFMVDFGVKTTASTDEDSNGQAGWSIFGESWQVIGTDTPGTGQTWTQNAAAIMKIRVNGPAAAAADPPGRPVGLGVTPGATQLALEWTAPSGSPTSYDVHYTSSTSVANDAAAGTSVGTEWVSVTGTVSGTSHTITGLTNNTAYRVRVRGKNAAGAGPWAFGRGTPKASTSGSTDATLSALVVNRFSQALTLDPTFSRTTYAYSAGEVSAGSRITVTPTVNETNATVTVNGTTVTSGSASGDISPAYGSNTIAVEVTAQAGNSRTYTIAIMRALPQLSWSGGSTAVIPEDPASTLRRFNVPAENVMSGTLAYAPTGTHPATLADDLGSGRTTMFTMSVGDVYTTPQFPDPSVVDDAVNEHDETFTVTIEPGTGYTVGSPSVMTVTITDNDPPSAPGSLGLVAGDGSLAASWTRPADPGPVTQYQVRWKETSATDQAATTAGDPSTGWVEGGAISSSSTSQTVSSLDNGTEYDVQVRANDGQTATGNGWGSWTATQKGTPIRRTYGFSPQAYTWDVNDVSNKIEVALTQAAPAGGLELTLTLLLGSALPSDLCPVASTTLAEAADIGASPPASVTVQEGETEASVVYPIADNGDDLVGGTPECFGVRLSTTTAGWTRSTANGVARIRIEAGGSQIAFGASAGSTAKHAAAVAENVSGGKLDVPVTVGRLPSASTTFAVEVVTAGTTATEWASTSSPGDFRIADKTVTFGPSTAKTQNVEVTITNDAAVEADETIELKLSDGPGTLSVNDAYLRHAQGRLAAVTIESEDRAPGAVRDLGVKPGNAKLDVGWKAPSDAGTTAVTGYDVHHTSSATVAEGAAVGTAVATGWVESGTPTATSQTISSLANDRPYRVRVRARNSNGAGPWTVGTGTPALKSYGFSITSRTHAPGTDADMEVTLSEAAPSGGLALTITRLLGTSVPSNLCGSTALATAADIGSNPPTSVTVASGQTAAAFNYPLADNGDDLVRGSECFALRLSTSVAGWNAGDAVARITITRNDGRIAFGSSAASTSKYAATVAETVSGGTLNVPVTVDWLPFETTRFTVTVESSGTATEYVDSSNPGDFRIADKTVTFGPSTAKTQNVAVTITNDAAAEAGETIELSLAATADVASPFYRRHAQGSKAAVTITSEDAAPGGVGSLRLRAGDAKLDASWTAPSNTGSTALTGYDVHYTRSGTVADDAAVGTAVATQWVDAGHSGTGLSREIAGLANDREHRVRVRAVNASGGGAWTHARATPSEAPAVTLAAAPNPVREGSSVTVTATLSRALTGGVTIPLDLSNGTAEEGDYATTLTGITVAGGQTEGTGAITTNQDTDTDDETFAVKLDEDNLPASVVAGTPDSVLVTITDDDRASATLEVSPNPVDEGSPVTVRVRLSKALPSDVTIPLALSRGTAEEGDYGDLSAVTVRRGQRTGTGTLATVRDADTDDEEFTVALDADNLPPSVEAGSPAAVLVTIRDDGPLRAELRASTSRPREGSTVVLTAELNHPAPAGGVRVRFYANGADEDPAYPVVDFTLDPEGENPDVTEWIGIPEGNRLGRARLRVVDDTEPEDDEGIAVALDGSWTEARPEIELTIPANDGGGGSAAVAWIEAEPNPVSEGSPVTVKVRLSKALEEAAWVPLTVTRGTSEEGDHGTLDGVEIAAGADGALGTIETYRDDDADDETFTVRLGSLPTGIRAGTPSSVTVEIDDADEPDVWLEVEPDAVEEGGRVTVTAVLASPLARSVTIPVVVQRITSESGDHGSLSSLRIAAGRRDRSATISTRVDTDTDDETFAVKLGADLPSGVERGHPDSVEVAIIDTTTAAPRAAVSLSAAPDPVPEGERVTVTATLSEALARSVTIPVEVVRGTSESGDHGSLSGIRVASGDTEGTGTVTTAVDSDTDDETFTVRLRSNLPSGVEAGVPDSVTVTIADRGGDAPGRVRSLKVTAGDQRLDLTWTAPASGTVTAYTVEYKRRSDSDWTLLYEDDYQDTAAGIAGLENGTRHDVRVRAENDHGDGPWATGSGTPTGGSSNADLRGLSVSVSTNSTGTFRSVSLSPSFRSSTTEYTARAPAGTEYARFRPTAASSRSLILVDGHETASGAWSPSFGITHGVAYYVSVISEDGSTATDYSVRFTIPAASMSSAGTATSAADAALARLEGLSPEDAASALLGERSLERTRLQALDRLGNANGRYDVGDLLAWIERCRAGAARCGTPPRTPPAASDAALPGTAAAAAKRPRRRPTTGRGRRKRRRTGMFAVLLAAALWSCDGAGVVDLPTGAVAPEPGTLTVEWIAPAGGPAAAGALVEIAGPDIGEVRAPGLELFGSEEGGAGPWRFVLAGDLRNGPVIEFEVPDRNLAGLYSVRVVEVAGRDHRLLEPDGYRAAITPH